MVKKNSDPDSRRNPESEKLERALIEKFGAEEFARARARAQFKAEFAKIMRTRRICLNLDQKVLAKKLHTTQQQLSRYELGDTSPTIERIYDICKELDLELIIREKDGGDPLICIGK